MTYPNCFEIIEPVVAPTYKTLKSMAANDRSLIELPNLNLEDVLSKLPLPSLIACCGVSKSLLNLIKNDSDFARMHFAKSEPQLMTQIQRHPGSSIYLIDLDTDTTSRVEVEPNFNIPLDGFYITQSCNGLLLLERMSKAKGVHRCMLYNPVTDSDVSSDSDHDPDTDSDPEVNSDSEMVYPEDDVMGAIYVTGSDSWESLGKLPFSPHHPCHLEKAVHWICVDGTVPYFIVFFNFQARPRWCWLIHMQMIF
ncbi:putative F-box domain-containing protein [Helianthus annuus]|uniref:F-box domain-containing protein n=1 Tax=Helianthus annuus TaxID=4232 RepID=A0A9K3N3Q1_HELAN|nr:putative F-box domain-containing protein [Helianthus annuus]